MYGTWFVTAFSVFLALLLVVALAFTPLADAVLGSSER